MVTMITATGEYALRAAVYLAQHHPKPQVSADVAAATQIPPGYLAKILQGMVKNGLIHSQRGLGGGFTLVRDPYKINVLEVLTAAGAPIQRIERCPLGLSTHTKLCPVHKLVDDGLKAIEEAFAQAILGELSLSLEKVPGGKKRPIQALIP
jgi:Rrf2 family transcriptional regulator, nitric oxide-sensitive transcriptional repressor